MALRALVTYFSLGGNTRKVAKALALVGGEQRG